MYRYFLTRDAERELSKELDYSAKQWGKRHAREYAKELQAKFRAITENPFIYPEREDILPGIRICACKGNHIIYTVVEEHQQVVVIGVLSVYQDVTRDKLQKRVM